MAKYPQNRSPRRPLVKQTCKHCKNAFYAKQSNIDVGKGVFCGTSCQRAGRKTRCDKKPRIAHVCKWCGKVFFDGKRLRETREYCSNVCLGLSKRKNGKEHPRRQQSAELQKWSRKVILRDKACVRCGAKENLQAHHVMSYSEHPDLRLDVNNGVALSPVCHHHQHPSHKLDWYVKRGGQSVLCCIVCGSGFVPQKKTQKTCSVSCGAKKRQSKRKYSYGD